MPCEHGMPYGDICSECAAFAPKDEGTGALCRCYHRRSLHEKSAGCRDCDCGSFRKLGESYASA